MSDYIERQAVIDAVHEEFDGCTVWDESGERTADEVESIIDRVLSADVAPVVHGRWLPIVSYNNTYKCSECGRLLVDITDGLKMVAKHYPYCHCGAKMDRG